MPKEHNIIQAPELLRELTRILGMRQAHVTPTLNEGVQASVIIGDVSRPRGSAAFAIGTSHRERAAFAGQATTLAGTDNAYRFGLQNPAGSESLARVNRLIIMHNSAAVLKFAIFIVLSPGTAGVGGAYDNGLAYDPSGLTVGLRNTISPVVCTVLKQTGLYGVGGLVYVNRYVTPNSNDGDYIFGDQTELVLLPGEALHVTPLSIATTLTSASVDFQYTEAPLRAA